MGSKGEHQKLSQSIALLSSGAHFSFLRSGVRYKFLIQIVHSKSNRHAEVKFHKLQGDRKDEYALDVGRKLGYRIIIEPLYKL